MSHSTLYIVNGAGDVRSACTFRNASRGAPLFWNAIALRYGIIERPHSLVTARPEVVQRLWNLWRSPEVDDNWRIVLVTTFDRVLTKRCDLERIAQAYEQFARDVMHPPGSTIFADPGDPGHAEEIARALTLVNAVGYAEIRGVCWNQSSVDSTPWQVCDGEGEYHAYNVDRDIDHWWLDLEQAGLE